MVTYLHRSHFHGTLSRASLLPAIRSANPADVHKRVIITAVPRKCMGYISSSKIYNISTAYILVKLLSMAMLSDTAREETAGSA